MPADLVWYVAYGSNLQQERFTAYLAGGRPTGARRTYAGCRDAAPPRTWRAVDLPGRILFAGESRVWGGGVAVYEPDGEGRVAGRAYLLTHGQLSDVVAQETRQDPGVDRDLACGVAGGDTLYDAVCALPGLDEHPVYTLGSRRPHPATAPGPAYLRRMVHGLAETFSWSAEVCADYLQDTDGVTPTWTRDDLLDLHPDRRTETT